jgi:Undecaprenyl-phosphate galactose phosphotransferase WbaP
MSLRQQLDHHSEVIPRLVLPDRPRNERGWVMFLGDFIAIMLSWYAANVIFFKIPIPTTFIGPDRIPVIEILSLERTAVLIGVILLFKQMGHYKDRIHYFFQLRSIFIACCLGIIAESVLRLYFSSPTSISGVFIAWGLVALFIMILRVASANFVCSREHFLQPTIILNDGALGQHAKEAVKRKPKLGYRQVDADDADSQTDWVCLSNRAINDADSNALLEFQKRAARTPADTLFLFSFDVFDQRVVPNAIKSLESLKRPFGFITSKTGIRLPRFEEFPFYGEDIILLLPGKQRPSRLDRTIKRASDIIIASLILIILAPLLAIIAFSIRRDGDPAFFKQTRVGRDGVHFECYKFRTMVVDAEARLADVLANDPSAKEEWEAHQKMAKDPRITATGKWLRKGSLDELPQLINVLKGEMSIVGPRPCFEDQIEQYGERFGSYLVMRPGITGLWQVSGRNQTTFEERAELEAWYVENWSMWLDLFVLVKTIPVVLLARGAH